MDGPEALFAQRHAEVRREIQRACGRAGRDPASIRIVVVAKSAPAAVYELLAGAGIADVGESRVQAALARRPAAAGAPLRWHLVGHLQSNKVRRAVTLFDVLHGVDSTDLLLRIDEAAAALGRTPEVLLQVKLGDDPARHGLAAEALPDSLAAAAGLQAARLVGLMTMAPEGAAAETARGVFRRLAALRDRHAASLPHLSMGMSDDFVPAVEEGATMLRIGRRLVGGLLGAAPALALWLLLCAAPAARAQLAAPAAAIPPDDLAPAAIDAVLAAPDDPFMFGIPSLAPGKVLLSRPDSGSGRCAADLGDVTGDRRSDFAAGFAADFAAGGPGSPAGSGGPGGSVAVFDGATGAIVWAAQPDGGVCRSLRALAAAPGRLALGVSSRHGRVEVRASASGTVLWSRDLLPVPRGVAANVLAVDWADDADGDGQADLLVAGGRQLDALWLLSGADGRTLWRLATTGPAADARPCADLDGDGRRDVFAVGGLDQPFACAVSGSDGALLWRVALPAPGSVVLPLADIDGDTLPDLVAGLFAEPASCVLALSGRDGARRWTSAYATRNATSLVTIGDVDGDGRRDVALGSMDNAVACVLAASGQLGWRTEGSIFNGGSMLSVANIGDVNDSGFEDVCTSSLDRHAYVLDGGLPHFISVHDLRQRGVAAAALGDLDGDGRRDFVFAADGALQVFGGDSGTAAGPIVLLSPPATPGGTTHLDVYALPTTGLMVLGSIGTGFLPLPGYTGALGLDLAAFGLIHKGKAPGSGVTGLNILTVPRELIGMTLYFQAITTYAPGHGAFGPVKSQHWVF